MFLFVLRCSLITTVIDDVLKLEDKRSPVTFIFSTFSESNEFSVCIKFKKSKYFSLGYLTKVSRLRYYVL